MKIRGIDYDVPELEAKNAEEIIKTCRDIHQMYIDCRKRNTVVQRWDKYWVAAYNIVLDELRKNRKVIT